MTSNAGRSTPPPLVTPRSLLDLDARSYWRILQTGADDVCQIRSLALPGWTDHEAAFGRYALLAMSPLGGFVWPDAELTLCNQTYRQVAPLVDNDAPRAYVIERRKGLDYPIAVASIVRFAAVLLVEQRMSVRTVRNQALTPITAETHLAPMAPGTRVDKPSRQLRYRRGLIARYLEQTADVADVQPAPDLETYLAVGRYLAAFLYDLDVFYTLTGDLDTGLPEMPQYEDRELLAKLGKPLTPPPAAQLKKGSAP